MKKTMRELWCSQSMGERFTSWSWQLCTWLEMFVINGNWRAWWSVTNLISDLNGYLWRWLTAQFKNKVAFFAWAWSPSAVPFQLSLRMRTWPVWWSCLEQTVATLVCRQRLLSSRAGFFHTRGPIVARLLIEAYALVPKLGIRREWHCKHPIKESRWTLSLGDSISASGSSLSRSDWIPETLT